MTSLKNLIFEFSKEMPKVNDAERRLYKHYNKHDKKNTTTVPVFLRYYTRGEIETKCVNFPAEISLSDLHTHLVEH